MPAVVLVRGGVQVAVWNTDWCHPHVCHILAGPLHPSGQQTACRPSPAAAIQAFCLSASPYLQSLSQRVSRIRHRLQSSCSRTDAALLERPPTNHVLLPPWARWCTTSWCHSAPTRPPSSPPASSCSRHQTQTPALKWTAPRSSPLQGPTPAAAAAAQRVGVLHEAASNLTLIPHQKGHDADPVPENIAVVGERGWGLLPSRSTALYAGVNPAQPCRDTRAGGGQVPAATTTHLSTGAAGTWPSGPRCHCAPAG